MFLKYHNHEQHNGNKLLINNINGMRKLWWDLICTNNGRRKKTNYYKVILTWMISKPHTCLDLPTQDWLILSKPHTYLVGSTYSRLIHTQGWLVSKPRTNLLRSIYADIAYTDHCTTGQFKAQNLKYIEY